MSSRATHEHQELKPPMVGVEGHFVPVTQADDAPRTASQANHREMVRTQACKPGFGTRYVSADCRRLLTLVLGAILAATLAACGANLDSLPELETYHVFVDDVDDVSSGPLLEGAEVSDRISVALQAPEGTKEVLVRVWDTSGQVVSDVTLHERPYVLELDTSQLPDGEYVLSATATPLDIQTQRVSRDVAFKVKNPRAGTSPGDGSEPVPGDPDDGTDPVSGDPDDGTDPVSGDPDDGTDPVSGAPDDGSEPAATRGTAMRGDPNFSESELSDEARLWYRRVWNAIENPDAVPNASGLARRGDLYQNGRALNEHITTLLQLFRATGDLRLLDEVDRLAELMRDGLTTKWYTTDGTAYDPTDGTAGKLRWNYYGPNSDGWYGRDEHELDSILAHSTVAAFAFAYHNNRDLESPTGVDYGARADFWLNYLQNNFEPIWRHRNDVPKGFPFLEKLQYHAYTNFARYHHYMGLLTGNAAYTDQANKMVSTMVADQTECSTDVGPALLWRHSVKLAGGNATYHQGSTYVRYDVSGRVDLFMEGYEEFGASHLQGIANAMSQYMYDGDPENTGLPFSASIGGDQDRCGLDFRVGWRSRINATRWATSSYGQVAAWDETGLIDDINDIMYEDHASDLNNPRSLAIPASKVLMASW